MSEPLGANRQRDDVSTLLKIADSMGVTGAYGSHLPVLDAPPITEVEERLHDLLDSPDDRLPLISLREAQAAVLLLRVLASGDGDGHVAAHRLASRIANRLPPDET
ncbi:hypothetical protein [Streptomyces sp. NPDC058653]|uniref:hypothetical protein n=1 Tax=Streptomyces sp. NPDC058653 TaxID=3346576 RepID=UPI003665BFC5